jgi:hypothetical protein
MKFRIHTEYRENVISLRSIPISTNGPVTTVYLDGEPVPWLESVHVEFGPRLAQLKLRTHKLDGSGRPTGEFEEEVFNIDLLNSELEISKDEF